MSVGTVSISSMGSGNLPASNDTVAGLHTTHPEIHLAMVYGITLAGLVVLAVVTVIITIVYHRRQEDTRTHCKERGSVHSNAGLTDLQNQIQSGESDRYSMDLITTQKENLESKSPLAQPAKTTERSSEVAECSATSLIPEEGEDQRTGIYGDIDDTGNLTSDLQHKQWDQFSFEDGATLGDYPASVDLEVADSYRDSDAQKAEIMGYPDIYNSQILKTVPPAGEDYTTNEKEDKYLTLPLPHTSMRQQRERISCSPPTKSELSELNVPTVITEKAWSCGTSEPVKSEPATSWEVSTGLAEAQEFLNRSVCDLLKMTEALSEEVCEEEIIPAHDLDNDIERVLLGEDDIEELQIAHV